MNTIEFPSAFDNGPFTRQWEKEYENRHADPPKRKKANQSAKKPIDTTLSQTNCGNSFEICGTPYDYFGNKNEYYAAENEVIIDGAVDPERSEFSKHPIPKVFGYFFETIIEERISSHLRENKVGESDIYYDASFAGSIDPLLPKFLEKKNKGLTSEMLEGLKNSYLTRPDVLVDNGSSIRSYYEIKPNSKNGRSKGRTKIKKIAEYVRKYGLPYSPGKALDIKEIDLSNTDLVVAGRNVQVKISLSLEYQDGVILYNICIHTDWECISEQGDLFELRDLVLEACKEKFPENIKNLISQQIPRLITEIKDVSQKVPDALIALILIVGLLELIPASMVALVALVFSASTFSLPALASDRFKSRPANPEPTSGVSLPKP